MSKLGRDRVIKLYDQLIAANPEIERKGKTVPYTSANTHMFSQINKEGELGLRLPKDQRDAFLEKYETSLFETYNTVMKEYVLVPDALLKNTDELSHYLMKSYQYVLMLKPNPQKKKG